MSISGRYWVILAGMFLSVLCPGTVWANSKFLNVQGRLTDNSGNPLTGTQTVTFRLYTSSAGGSATWTESQAVVLSTGLFNVALGSVTALDSLSFNQLYYLGIQVAGDANELSPRQQLGASAYAQGSMGNFNVGENLIVSSSVTASGDISIGGKVVITGQATVGGQAVIAGQAVITGQVVVAGTMTVSGNAFSVGGSTFAVSGGRVGISTSSPQTTLDVNGSAQFGAGATKSTFTAAGLLKLTSSGIQWADGSTNTTSVLTATQTFTGANTFSSTSTFTGDMYYVHDATFTARLPSASGTNTNWAGCNVAGSTITATFHSNGGIAKATLFDSVKTNSAGNYLQGGILMDGRMSIGSNGYSEFYNVQAITITDQIVHATALWVNVSSGPHKFCYGYGTNVGATWTKEAGVGIFFIEEIK